MFRYVKEVWWWSRTNRELDSKFLEVHELDQTKRYNWKRRTFQEVPRRRKFYFLNKNSGVILDPNIPSVLVLNLDQTPLSHVSSGKFTLFHQKRSKNVPIKGLDDKRQITATFLVTATGSFLFIHLIYQGKSKRCLPKFTFPSDFHVTFITNNRSNL